MSANDSGLRDEASAELNPQGDGIDYGPQPDPIPDRPAASAKLEEWHAYLEALGMHPDEAAKVKAKQEAADLADRFGG